MYEASQSQLLTKNSMENTSHLPSWLYQEYKTFEEIVTNPTFPCFFGMTGQRKGELRYTYLAQDDWRHLPKTVESFLQLLERTDAKRHGLFIFVEPEKRRGRLNIIGTIFGEYCNTFILRTLLLGQKMLQKTLNTTYGTFILVANLSLPLVMHPRTNSAKQGI